MKDRCHAMSRALLYFFSYFCSNFPTRANKEHRVTLRDRVVRHVTRAEQLRRSSSLQPGRRIDAMDSREFGPRPVLGARASRARQGASGRVLARSALKH